MAIPGASIYGQQYAQANQAYQQALAKIRNQRSALLRQYGYQTGPDGQLRVADNPSGLHQQMLASHASDLNALEDASNASGFQMGAANRALHDTRTQQQGQEGQQLEDLSGQLSDLTGQEADAGSQFNDTLYQAQLDAARQSIDNGDFTPADFHDPGLYDPMSPVAPPHAPEHGPMGQPPRRHLPAPTRFPARGRQRIIQQAIRRARAHRPATLRRRP